MNATLLTARQAADRLGIKVDTLYAYVSRGRLRSVTVPGTRERRYPNVDVEALLDARSGVRLPASADPEALMPVIGSSICLIENGRFYYRGQDAVRLSRGATLEDITRLLWLDETGPELTDVIGPEPGHPFSSTAASGLIERCQIRLTSLGDEDLSALDLSRARVARTGWRILRELAACVAPSLPTPEPIHCRLAAAWRLGEPAADLLRRCLVLIADHELNPSTFVARCVASTGATPYAVIVAALGALSGRLHGGETARAEGLFLELMEVGDPMAVMAGRLARDRYSRGARASRARGLRACGEGCRNWVAPDRTSAQCRFRPRRNGDRIGTSPRRRARAVHHRPHGRLDRSRDRAIRKRRPDPSSCPLSRPATGRGHFGLGGRRGHEIEPPLDPIESRFDAVDPQRYRRNVPANTCHLTL